MNRLLGWNGLQITVPGGCDDIVSGRHHVVIEKDFRPVLELRWENGSIKRKPAPAEVVCRKLLKSQPETLREGPAPAGLLEFSKTNGVHCLHALPPDQGLNLIWQCATCKTLVTVRTYPHPDFTDTSLSSILESLRCHKQPGALILWSMQDFQLELPETFELQGYRFEAGFTRLLFHDRKTRLLACRIAPASDKLADENLSSLLCSLHEQFSPEQVVAEGEELAYCSTSPSITQQLRQRLRRKKPFCTGLIRHLPKPNRLIAFIQESTQPIDRTTLEELFSRYEIIS